MRGKTDMKIKSCRLIIVAVTLAFIFCRQIYAVSPEISQLEQTSMSPFSEPHVATGVLKNGMRYFLLEDHQLPFIHVRVITKAGGIYDPADKVGLATLTGIMLRTGGTKELTPEEVDRRFDDMAADVDVGIGQEMGEADIKVLSKDGQRALSLFFDLLFSPRFEEKRIELGRIKIIEALKREDDYPEQVVVREFKKLVYGDDSPWARRPTNDSVRGLTKIDLRQFHKDYFVPSNMIISAAGDFVTKSFLDELNKLTQNAPNHTVQFSRVKPVDLSFLKQERQIEKPITQSYIEVGHLGIKRHNPDKYALEIMDMILGAPYFKSRLMEDIRSNRGLAYTIASDFGWGTDYGLFDVSAATKVESTKEVIALIGEHLRRLVEKGDVTATEIDFAKKAVLNHLIFEFDNAFKMVVQRARYQFYGYPDNYLQIYRNKIEKVTVDDVCRVARKYLHPDGLSLVVVGPRQ